MTSPEIQVTKEHYGFSTYMTLRRWVSLWHQLRVVSQLNPACVLEIGPGPGYFQAMARLTGINIKSFDIDPQLNPDYCGNFFENDFSDGQFDLTCAFQVLEHLPYEMAMVMAKEMSRVAARHVVISLPNANKKWPLSITLPKGKHIRFLYGMPNLFQPTHHFDGQHHWEINTHGHCLKDVICKLETSMSAELTNEFRVHEYPYHQFFVFSKTTRNAILHSHSKAIR